MDYLSETTKNKIKSTVQGRKITLPDGTSIPLIGQGTWRMGEDVSQREKEIQALRLGLELGMNLIDTAEMYGEGGAEEVVGEAMKGKRDEVFLISKVYPYNASFNRIEKAVDASLARLRTEYLDMYLLHWRGGVHLEEMVAGMEELRKKGKIKRWGVSNFDTADMEALWNVEGGRDCAINQVLYHLGSRGIDYDLMPWHRANNIPIMAYSPLAQGGSRRTQLLTDPTMLEIAKRHGAEPLQIALAWTLRSGECIAIPKATKIKHVITNAKTAEITLTEEDLEKLDQVFFKPTQKMPLDII